jgi:hypothetical protein
MPSELNPRQQTKEGEAVRKEASETSAKLASSFDDNLRAAASINARLQLRNCGVPMVGHVRDMSVICSKRSYHLRYLASENVVLGVGPKGLQ